jgi:hypothetical protein
MRGQSSSLQSDQVKRRYPKIPILAGILCLVEFEIGAFFSPALFLDNLHDF